MPAAGPAGASPTPLAWWPPGRSDLVRSNMRDEEERLQAAFTLDLISADDFAGYNRRALRRRRSR
jgi:hypothetical protein